MSDYRLQVVYKQTGEVAKWRAGKDGIEVDMVDDLCARLEQRPIGLLTGKEAVLRAVREELGKVLWDLKAKVTR